MILRFLVVSILAAAPVAAAAAPSASAERVAAVVDVRAMDAAEIQSRVQQPLTLDDCIAIALARNLALRIARGDLEAAEATHSGSHGKFLPVMSVIGVREQTFERRPLTPLEARSKFSGSALVGAIDQALPTGATLSLSGDLHQNITEPGGLSVAREHLRLYQANFSQPLFRGAGTTFATSPIRLSRLDVDARQRDVENARLQTVLAVRLAFYDVLRDLDLLEVQEEAIAADSQLVEASNAMVEAKIASRRDVLSAQIRLSDDASALVVTQREYQLSLDRLKDVMGVAIEAPIAVVPVELDDQPVALDEPELIRRAQEKNPAIESAQFALSRSRLQLRVARNGARPRVDLNAGLTGTLNTASSGNLRSNGWLASVSVGYPLFDREASGAARAAAAAASQDQDRLENVRRRVALGVRDVVRTVRSTAEEIRAIRRTIEFAEEKVDFSTAMFNLGRASNLDITDARESLLKGRTQYVRKLVDYHGQLALLESLTGEPVSP